MTGVAEAKLAMDGIKLALDVIKALQAGKVGAEFKAQLIEARAAILDAQEHASAAYARETELTHRIRELEAKVTALETWDAEKKRYQLERVSGGNFAYAMKESEAGVEPMHYACQKCFEDGKKSIFQFTQAYDGGPVHQCPRCKMNVILPLA